MIDAAEIDTLVNVLRGQLRDATTGLYAEKKWARAVELELKIIEQWRSQSVNASDLDDPVWTVEDMNRSR